MTVEDPAPTEDAAAPAPAPAGDRILFGVCGTLGARLGVDATWVRLGFVVAGIAHPAGLVVYGALALVLAGEVEGRRWLRWAGGTVLALTLLVALGAGSPSLFAVGPFEVAVLLAGVALALWRPASRPAPPAVRSSMAAAAAARPAPPPRRPPSLLGRTTLGAAVAVAGIGGLIDSLDGGRLHPEQWLGAAAITCGIGLLVGTVRGRGRWLVVPALAFAGGGHVLGIAAGVGVNAFDGLGDQYLWFGEVSGGYVEDIEHLAGTQYLTVEGRPAEPLRLDVAVGFGDLVLDVTDDVTVEVLRAPEHGAVFVDGDRRPAGPVLAGPGDEADVVVDARIAYGDVRISRSAAVRPELPDLPDLPDLPIPPGAELFAAGELVRVTSDGWVVLGDGEIVLDPDDEVVAGIAYELDTGILQLESDYGLFQLLPRGLLIDPYGNLVDLQAARDAAAPTTTTTTGATDG